MVTRFFLLAVAASSLLVSAVKVPLKQTKRTDRLDRRNGNSNFRVLAAAAGDGDDSGLLDLECVRVGALGDVAELAIALFTT